MNGVLKESQENTSMGVHNETTENLKTTRNWNTKWTVKEAPYFDEDPKKSEKWKKVQKTLGNKQAIEL